MDGRTDRIQNLKLTLEEARREYELKTERLEEIDDKALRLSRTATLVIGFAVSAVSVGGSSSLLEIPAVHIAILSIGLTMTLFTSVLGVIISSVTGYPAGIDPEQRGEASSPPYGYQSALSSHIQQYEFMIEDASKKVNKNSQALDTAQLLVFLGTLFLFVGAGGFVIVIAAESFYQTEDFALYIDAITLGPPTALFHVGIKVVQTMNKRE